MITTNDDEIAAQIRLLRNHGSSQQYHHDVIGYNSRLDELQAVILRIKLKYIDEYNQKRLAVARSYNERLSNSRFQTPTIADDRDHVFHQYTVLCDQRDAVREHVLSRGVACAVYYPIPLHQQKVFADSTTAELPVTESTASRCLSLPIFPEITEAQIASVCEAILSA
jgi:dTDP-4-amino-4,6-dideoxygalactose transaminase